MIAATLIEDKQNKETLNKDLRAFGSRETTQKGRELPKPGTRKTGLCFSGLEALLDQTLGAGSRRVSRLCWSCLLLKCQQARLFPSSDQLLLLLLLAAGILKRGFRGASRRGTDTAEIPRDQKTPLETAVWAVIVLHKQQGKKAAGEASRKASLGQCPLSCATLNSRKSHLHQSFSCLRKFSWESGSSEFRHIGSRSGQWF